MDENTLLFLLCGGHLSMSDRIEKGLWPHPPLLFSDVVGYLVRAIELERWFPYEWQPVAGEVISEGGIIERQSPSEYIYHVYRHQAIHPNMLAEQSGKIFTSAQDAARHYLKWDLHLPGDLDGWQVIEEPSSKKKLKIAYQLFNAGWAEALFTLDEVQIRVTASYLHNSLKDLADMTLSLIAGASEARSIFMDEPGEMHLVVMQTGDGYLYLELHWYEDWQNWNKTPADHYEISGKCITTTLAELREQVINVLQTVRDQYGLDEYKAKWLSDDFPDDELSKLKETQQTG